MDVLLIMVILAAAAVFVSAPLRRSPDAELPLPAQGEEPELAELVSARDAKLRELRDAELDHRMGKLSDQDFQALDATLRAEAIEILRALDQTRERLSADEGRHRPPADTING